MTGPELVKDSPRNLIAFAAGVSNSGKSRALHHLYTARTSRVISLDFMAEVPARNPDCIRTYGFPELKECLADMARENIRRWHIAAVLEVPDVERLFRMLAPPVTSAESTSYTREVGGLAVECGECSIIAPNRATPEPVRAAFMRGRHHFLSLYMATQRPAETDRCVTAMAHALHVFATHEDVDLQFWRKKTSAAVADLIVELPRHHSVRFIPGERTVSVLDENYQQYREMNLRGDAVAVPA